MIKKSFYLHFIVYCIFLGSCKEKHIDSKFSYRRVKNNDEIRFILSKSQSQMTLVAPRDMLHGKISETENGLILLNLYSAEDNGNIDMVFNFNNLEVYAADATGKFSKYKVEKSDDKTFLLVNGER